MFVNRLNQTARIIQENNPFAGNFKYKVKRENDKITKFTFNVICNFFRVKNNLTKKIGNYCSN